MYVLQRTRDVVLYFFHTLARVESKVSMNWPIFIQVWQESTAQMLKDRVPPDLILSRGVFDVVLIWDTLDHTKFTGNLPNWTYDPELDKTGTKFTSQVPCSRGLARSTAPEATGTANGSVDNTQDLQSDTVKVSNANESNIPDPKDFVYHWPDDSRCYDFLASEALQYRAEAKPHLTQYESPFENCQRMVVDLRIVQLVMAQHQYSTFRVLVRLTTDNHKQVFDEGAEIGRAHV